jgi:hypothetical protein
MMVNLKRQEALPVWGESMFSDLECDWANLQQDLFIDNSTNFSTLFRRILTMTLNTSSGIGVRTSLLQFVMSAYQSLDSGLIRRECAPLVSISLWHHLNSESARNRKLDAHGQLRKAWKAAGKRFEAADEEAKARLLFDRSWLYSMLLDFLNLLQIADDPGMLKTGITIPWNSINLLQKTLNTANAL